MELVSVLIITYNSAQYVIETLESVNNQTYQNIELIVSDDCSTDNTVEICKKWVIQNKDRFVNTKILTVKKNTGISANCNRCLEAAKSNWVKFIAGDDILLDKCLEDNMIFVDKNPDAKIIFSQAKLYQDQFNLKNFIRLIPENFPENLMCPNYSAKDQYQLLLLSDRITYTPSSFFNKNILAKVGNYDDQNRFVEDYPMWLKLTKAGHRLCYFHKSTVGYRVHGGAMNNTGEDLLFKPSAINGFEVRKIYAHPHLPKRIVLQEKWVYEVTKIFKLFGIKKRNGFNSKLYKGITVYANPFVYYNAILKRIR